MMKVEEIKLRQSDGSFVEADVEYKDGVLFVSPKVEKFEPKDGDVVTCGWESKDLAYSWTAIFNGDIEKLSDNFFVGGYCSLDSRGEFLDHNSESDSVTWVRFATEEEKQKLFDKLAEEGWEWKADTKELVKLKWKPKDHEEVFVVGFTFFGEHPFCPFEDKAYSDSMQWRAVLDRGWYFKTEEECQAFCDKLNQAISQVKP